MPLSRHSENSSPPPPHFKWVAGKSPSSGLKPGKPALFTGKNSAYSNKSAADSGGFSQTWGRLRANLPKNKLNTITCAYSVLLPAVAVSHKKFDGGKDRAEFIRKGEMELLWQKKKQRSLE
jgi:hypothetical protein